MATAQQTAKVIPIRPPGSVQPLNWEDELDLLEATMQDALRILLDVNRRLEALPPRP